MFPITNDATTIGILLAVLGLIFYTSKIDTPFFKGFYKYIPALLLAYFLPAILGSLGIIPPHWYDAVESIKFLKERGIVATEDNFSTLIKDMIKAGTLGKDDVKFLVRDSSLYFVASRYLLPASLILLTLSTDIKAIIGLGPKAIIMFLTATVGIVIGGPVALMLVGSLDPTVLAENGENSIWKGLATVAGSWIGGGANQTAMKEIYESGETLFSAMIIVDVVVANLWMAFLLYGAGISDKIDGIFKADNSAVTRLKESIASYKSTLVKPLNFQDLMVLMAIVFGAVGLSHLLADIIAPTMSEFIKAKLEIDPQSGWKFLSSLGSGFFWLVVFATAFGLSLSFTKVKKYEGIGASNIGSLFIYILVATIGMKMDLADLYNNWADYKSLILIGLVWMLIHVIILLVVAKIIKAPFFYVAVGSQANVGGAASAPIVASAFSPSLAPVGVLLAVLGYTLGTFAAMGCALMMKYVSM